MLVSYKQSGTDLGIGGTAKDDNGVIILYQKKTEKLLSTQDGLKID
jgi:hypothetical protein